MIGLVTFKAAFWIFMSIGGSHGNDDSDSNHFLEKKKRSTPRGYYGYPYLPFSEPLTILAGLAFLAYIIQAFHAVYHQHHGLGGGLLNNVLPSKSKNLFPKVDPNEINEYTE